MQTPIDQLNRSNLALSQSHTGGMASIMTHGNAGLSATGSTNFNPASKGQLNFFRRNTSN